MANIDPTHKYHETPISRARTLYRIPTVPNGNRILELYHNRQPILTGCEWPGVSKNICRIDTCQDLNNSQISDSPTCHFYYLDQPPFPDNSFDLIILHRTLDEVAYSAKCYGTTFDAAAFLDRIAQKLTPHGLIAGCVDNRISKKSIFCFLNKWITGIQLKSPQPSFSLVDLRNLLSHKALDNVRIYTLLPSADEPLRLIDVTPSVSKIAFRHEIEYARCSYSRLGYLIRSLAVEVGLYPYLEESFFFSAYRRC